MVDNARKRNQTSPLDVAALGPRMTKNATPYDPDRLKAVVRVIDGNGAIRNHQVNYGQRSTRAWIESLMVWALCQGYSVELTPDNAMGMENVNAAGRQENQTDERI